MIHSSCNCTAKPPPPVKVVLMGPDSYVNSVLRCYVEQFSSKPPDWKNYLKFYIVPLVTNAGGGCSGSNNNSGNNDKDNDSNNNSNTVSDNNINNGLTKSMKKLMLRWLSTEALDGQTEDCEVEVPLN